MTKGKRKSVNLDGVLEFLKQLYSEEKKGSFGLFVGLCFLGLVVEKWVFEFSNWVLLALAVWATLQYGSYQRQILVEDLNRKWKQVILNTSPTTPLEQCEWLNRLLMEVWPNYISQKLSLRFSSIIERRLKKRKSRLIESLELLEFSLGSCPPTLGFNGTRWSTSGDQRIMHIGFDWDTNDMSILLLAKLARPFMGTARIVVNSLQIKGDILLMPVLDGRSVLYSFVSTPEVRIGVAFGSGGSQSLPATELPGVSSWLVKIFTDTLVKTMVEPRRRCLSLPAVELRKKAVSGILHVTVVSASKLSSHSLKNSPSSRQHTVVDDESSEGGSENKNLRTFVEVELEELSRKTNVRQGTSPKWNSKFNMVLHEDTGSIRFNLYECTPNSVKYDYLASCEVKMKYVTDDSTTFWAIGPDSGIIAKHAEFCGREVEMVVPFEGVNAGELTVRLVLKEWQFSDGSHTANTLHLTSRQSLNGSANFLSRTGRKIHVVVVEGRDLIAKERSGKCDPYLRLQYGKTSQRTRTAHSSNPVWNQKFEFDEIAGGEYLKVKCLSEDTFSDDSIGSARVNLEGLVDGSTRDIWVPLEKAYSGELRLQIEAIKVEDFEGSRGSSSAQGSGWIELEIIEAKDLIAADFGGTSDPYVRVQYGNLKKRTKVLFKTLNPKWNQTLEFPDDGSTLVLHVKDHNAVLPTSSIGDCVVEYQRLPQNQTSDKWIPLQGVKRGEIHIRITRKLPERPRPSLDSEPSLTKAHKICGQMKEMMVKIHSLIDNDNQEGLPMAMSELESLAYTQEEYMVQLETEQLLLLDKVNELGQEIINSTPSISRNASGR